jgi:hypothetical protein
MRRWSSVGSEVKVRGEGFRSEIVGAISGEDILSIGWESEYIMTSCRNEAMVHAVGVST